MIASPTSCVSVTESVTDSVTSWLSVSPTHAACSSEASPVVSVMKTSDTASG